MQQKRFQREGPSVSTANIVRRVKNHPKKSEKKKKSKEKRGLTDRGGGEDEKRLAPAFSKPIFEG